MKKTYCFRMVQGNQISFVGKVSAQCLAPLAVTPEKEGEVQEAQRPYKKKRVIDIAKYVLNGGMISSSIILGTRTSAFTPKKVEGSPCNDLYYIEFPETEEEFEEAKESFDVVDGQHRLFAFLAEYMLISRDIKYELPFNLYVEPTLEQRRLIFKNTNEKQEKVSQDVLVWLRKQLDLMSNIEKAYFPLCESLNNEPSSPLYGRIVLRGEKKSNAFKAVAVISILDKAHVKELENLSDASDSLIFTVIRDYLKGWENAVGAKIGIIDKSIAPFSKIAGFRFMMMLFPYFARYSQTHNKAFNTEFVTETINALFAKAGFTARDVFDQSSELNKNEVNKFAGESNVNANAKVWGMSLNDLEEVAYNPFASYAK